MEGEGGAETNTKAERGRKEQRERKAENEANREKQAKGKKMNWMGRRSEANREAARVLFLVFF